MLRYWAVLPWLFAAIEGCHSGDASLEAPITSPWEFGSSEFSPFHCCRFAPYPPLCPVGSKESLFSSTITASEEAMTVLEEVIMYTFQQCVYYISKVCARMEGSSIP